MRSTGWSRTGAIVGASVAAAAVLTACGSDPPQEVPAPNYATVTGAGKNIAFPANVTRADYPNACKLMPDDSMQALIGSPVTSGRTTAGCAWTSGEASLPTIALQFVEIGSDASTVYTERRSEGTAARNLPNLGSRSRIYRINENMTTRIDVLKPGVFFRVEVRLPVAEPQDLQQAEQIGTRTAQLIADQVS